MTPDQASVVADAMRALLQEKPQLCMEAAIIATKQKTSALPKLLTWPV